MGKVGKRLLEGQTKQQRQSQRKELGTLRSLTVSSKTSVRYASARTKFYEFLRENSLEIPRRRELFDGLLAEYIEHLWSEGEGRGLAADTVAGLQDSDPKLKGQLQLTWRLLKTWNVNEVPNRAPPLTEAALEAMVGWSFFHGHFGFGVSLLVGFYSMLRTGELTTLRSSHIFMKAANAPAVLSLGLTKSGKRVGAAESVTLTVAVALRWLWAWKQCSKPHALFVSSVSAWRRLFSECLSALQLTLFEFRPYSLRRGGATWWFTKHSSFDKLMVAGRWQAAKTARIYLNESMAVLADMRLPQKSLLPFARVFHNQVSPPHLSTRTRRRKRGTWKGGLFMPLFSKKAPA